MSNFRTTLVRIGTELDQLHVKNMIFLAQGTQSGFSTRGRTNAIDFFTDLQNRGLIRQDEPTFLRELLEIIGRNDLAGLLPQATGAPINARVYESRKILYTVARDMDPTNIGQLKFYCEMPGGMSVTDGIDIIQFLSEKNKLEELATGLRDACNRVDLALRMDQVTARQQGEACQ